VEVQCEARGKGGKTEKNEEQKKKKNDLRHCCANIKKK
jgi:hypothetical protein